MLFAFVLPHLLQLFLQAATFLTVKFKQRQQLPQYRQQVQTQKQLLCLQQRKSLKAPPILQNRTKTTKIKRTKKTIKIPKTKRTARLVRRTAVVLLLKKVKKTSRFQATVLRIRKSRLLHQTVLQDQTKRMMFSLRHRISTKPIPCRRESQSRLSRRSRKQRIQTFIVPLQ